MPAHDLSEYIFTTRFDHVAMAWYDPVEVPLINLGHTLSKARPVAAAGGVPHKAPLRQPRSACAIDVGKDLGQYARFGWLAGLAELLSRRQIEDEVGLDERLVLLEVEDKLLVRMRVDELVIEFGVKLLVYSLRWLGCGEDDTEGHILGALLRPLFRKTLGAQDLRVGVCVVPLSQKDVMLCESVSQSQKMLYATHMASYFNVGSTQVFDTAQFRDRLLDLRRQGDRREDCQVS